MAGRVETERVDALEAELPAVRAVPPAREDAAAALNHAVGNQRMARLLSGGTAALDPRLLPPAVPRRVSG